MIVLDNEKLRKLQMTELELLVEVDRICKKNDIKYSLDGGTLLGAVRHAGFIPWDDDADVMMTREEYERFFEACKSDLNYEKYFLQEFRTDAEYRWGYAKLRKNGTTFLREGQEHINCHVGVCIDIFIFDEVPDGYFERRLHWVQCFIIRKGLYSIVGQKNEKNRFIRVIYRILAKTSRAFWTQNLERLVRKESGKNRQLLSHLTYPNRKEIRYGLPSQYFDEYCDIEFEGVSLRAIASYDKYLRDLFGDYMVLPSKQNRKVHPVSKLEL